MATPRVCVIGGGVLGLASAVFLGRRGVEEVTVLEASHVAAGSSGLSVGIIETQYIEPLDIELRARGMSFFDELEEGGQLEITRNGYLRLARDERSLEAAERSVEVQHQLGIADARVIDRDQIQELVPQMRCEDILGGLHGPSDGFVDGHLYCNLLAEMAIAQGTRLMVRRRVVEAVEGTGSIELRTDRDESIHCDFVVNAAGAWAPQVAEIVGGEMVLVPQRHQAAVVSIPEPFGYLMPSVMDYIPHSGETGLYFRHERADQLIAGLHSEEIRDTVTDPDSYARSADQEFLELVAEKLLYRLPGFSEAGLGNGWAGLYPVSPDGFCQVGPNPGNEAVINAGGAGGSGIQLSPVIGELVAEWIVDGEAAAISDAEQLLPGRASLAEPVGGAANPKGDE
jgi:sarcosine oxidase subunit beta